MGEHVEDSAHGGARDAHGGEAVFDGFEVGDGGGAEFGVLVEGFLGIYVEVLEVEELLAEEEAGVEGRGILGMFGGEGSGGNSGMFWVLKGF